MRNASTQAGDSRPASSMACAQRAEFGIDALGQKSPDTAPPRPASGNTQNSLVLRNVA